MQFRLSVTLVHKQTIPFTAIGRLTGITGRLAGFAGIGCLWGCAGLTGALLAFGTAGTVLFACARAGATGGLGGAARGLLAAALFRLMSFCTGTGARRSGWSSLWAMTGV